MANGRRELALTAAMGCVMRIIGVDFSGSKLERNTWLAEGDLAEEERVLTLQGRRPVRREDLAIFLERLEGPTVAAMTTPFAAPAEFADFWLPEARGMPDLWAAAARMEWLDFEAMASRFGDELRERGVEEWPERVCDKVTLKAKSPLSSSGSTIMLPMTFRGMQFLHRLRAYPAGNAFWTPPLRCPRRQPRTELVEILPSATLRRLGLFRKGYKTARDATERRLAILEGLEGLTGRLEVRAVDREALVRDCAESDDALDAVIAAVTAAMWHLRPGLFRRPETAEERAAAQREGWIYAPKG